MEHQLKTGEGIKSQAVVKYAALEPPAKFLQLQPKTDLKLPPANWLRGDPKIQNMASGKVNHDDFPSFNMANGSPELIGENVDVVSDSKNIKKLLKIPYSKGNHISMMVHRVGKTLLLDEFDIHRHLLRKQQDDWRWLRKFYYETILQNMSQDKEKWINKKNRSRDVLQNRNMLSKFLYYSIGEDAEFSLEADPSSVSQNDHQSMNQTKQAIPEPEKPQQGSSYYQRELLWNFEDIRMLLGTDLPIFGGGTHPCVSLRLQDNSKPINVLTGIDYWLDNLMCNVPEIAMCYHLNGIVEGYELLKTADIPNIEGSKFSPNVIKDVAQNILSFLKTNATQEGHTYWLFKGSNDDVVKLYDLTTLCADNMDGPTDNPFSIPVGILLYRVARNLSKTSGKKKSGTIRTLLKNCLMLLDKEEHAQVVTSANYLMSDLYVPDDISSVESDVSSESEDEEYVEQEQDQAEEEDESCRKSTTSVEVQALCLAEKIKEPGSQLQRYPAVCGNKEDRCREALKHILAGLQCLDTSATKCTTHIEPEEQAKCNPYEAIPMHYEPINKMTVKSKDDPDGARLANHRGSSVDNEISTRAGHEDLSSHAVSKLHLLSLPHNSWHTLSKFLLLKKAVLAYYGVVDSKLAIHEYGQAMKYLKISLKCLETMRVLLPAKFTENSKLLGEILASAADIRLMLIHSSDIKGHIEDMDNVTDIDLAILESAEKELTEFEYMWVCEVSSDVERSLVRCAMCYELALQYVHVRDKDAWRNIQKRFGNVHNELGVFYMNQASNCADNAAKVIELCKQGGCCFRQGIEAFELIRDKTNTALLYSNYGRLMRLCAKSSVKQIDDGSREEFSQQEKHYYLQAADHYKKALSVLERRGAQHAEIWDSVTWELSTVYFNMATLMQDHAPLSHMAKDQVEKEVTELMTKALKYCDVNSEQSRQIMCQYRAASIHHRLASLYHNAFRAHNDSIKKKHLRQLAELHYGKTSAYFKYVDTPCELLRVQLERVALEEYQLTGLTNVSTKQKLLLVMLGYIIDSRGSIDSIHKQLSDKHTAQPEFEGYVGETEKLLGILESRLQFVLLNLVKNSAANAKKNKSDGVHKDDYKAMYAVALKQASQNSTLQDKCFHLLGVLYKLQEMYQKLECSAS
ncbi:unnamed protein product [Owenia fusiformis]|uniref:Erythroid differentiation-related factor 1 n=1 Tax=Owenia fusiformis TaxID=6347 RepID=A0A8S4NQG3_OWEFU|nr:unnamed protein product [Owenia fusiformis]